MLTKLGVASILLLFSLVNSCFNDSCEDCDYKTHSEVYDPFRTHHVWEDFYYGSTNKTPVFPPKEKIEIKQYECTLVTYDTKNGNGKWIKTITRSSEAKDLKDCEEKKLDRKNYRNVICFSCKNYHCNSQKIEDAKYCYSCKCQNCSSHEANHQNCIVPTRATEIIPLEPNEMCILTSWVDESKGKVIYRNIGNDLNQCWSNSHQPESKFSQVICKTCNYDRCNGEDLTTKNSMCYECECHDCTFEKSSNCIKPGGKTKLTKPLRNMDFCILFVSRSINGETYIQRTKDCEPDYCETKFNSLPGHFRKMCIICNDNKCNGYDRTDVILQMMQLIAKSKHNRTKCLSTGTPLQLTEEEEEKI